MRIWCCVCFSPIAWGRQEGRVHFDRAGVLPSVDGKVKKEQGRVIMVSSGV